ncbi:MAG: ATP-binding cassette domain-containing protein [Candidatus Paceibacterota bacterium]
MRAISIKNLSYSYPGNKDKVLDNINLEIPQGGFFVLAGPSGSGKSTLLMLMRGFSQEFGGKIEGKIFVGGLDVCAIQIAELGSTIGIVFQNPGLQLHQLKVFDEIMSAGMYRGFPFGECKQKTEKLIKEVVGEDIGQCSPEELSGGQKQKVALAAALMFDAPVLLLDEPFSFLDGGAKQEFLDILVNLNKQGKTIIVVTHDVGLVAPWATQMAVIDHGHILKSGNAAEVIYSDQMAKTSGVPLFVEMAKQAKIKERPLSWQKFPSGDVAVNKFRQKYVKAHQNSEISLSLENVGFSYPGGKFGLKNISCDFYRGEIFGFVGVNGSGKSTLVKVVSGFLKIKTGKIMIGGEEITNLASEKRARRIGYSTQDPLDMFFESTVLGEVSAGPKFLHLDGIRKRAEVILNDFSLAAYKDRHPDSISGGEKKRLAIADIAINDVDIILLDEPEFGLDQKNWGMVCDYLRRLANRGKTIIIITQDLEAVYCFCDRVGVFCDGEIVAIGRPERIFLDEKTVKKGGLITPGIMCFIKLAEDRKGAIN